MFRSIKNYFNRKKLKDEAYAYLFEDAPKGEYVVYDCETTGLDPKKAEILTIGAVKIKDNKILMSQKFDILVRPEKEIDAEAIKVHHLRHCDVENGMQSTEAIKSFLEFIGPRDLVGYYLEFDVAMVNKYVKPLLGITLPNRQTEISGMYHDYKIERIPQGSIDLRFDVIREELEIPALGKHSAINDALMTALIFIKLNALTRRKQ